MTATPCRIRTATPDDLEAVTAIYNEGIRGRTATFDTAERTVADVASWLEPRHPFLVAETGSGGVAGWIRAGAYRPRACYDGVGDFSVYVASTERGRGVGDSLLAALLPACEAAGFWKLVARIFPENGASRALCARHGFREVGTYRRHARLDGRWRDVVIVERLLGAALE